MKPCFKCNETKPLSDFYAHPMMADGHVNKCKECNKRDVRENRKARLDYYAEYDRKRNKELKRLKPKQLYNSLHPHPEYQDAATKREAHVALGNAVRDGKVPKPPECEVCGRASGKLHGHHEDYDKPLMVIWCCIPCHNFIHMYWRAREGIVDHATA